MSGWSDHPVRTARRRIGALVREEQWVLPLVGAVLGIILGLALYDIDSGSTTRWTITVSQSRATLAALVALMFTILSLSLSLTTITLNNMASHYSLRMLNLEVDDYRNKIATSVFALAVSFIGVELFKLTELPGDELAPRASFTVAVILIVFSGVTLFWQLNYTVQSIRLDRTLARLHRVTRRSAMTDARRSRRWVPGERPTATGRTEPLHAESSGYIVDVDYDAIRKTVQHGSVRVVIERQVGSPVVAGDQVGWVSVEEGSSVGEAAGDITSSLAIAEGRDIGHDVGLGIRMLVDIASLALSPAINDAYTAVQVTHELTAVLDRLGRMELGPAALVVDGESVAWVARPTLAEYLALATEQIHRYGAAEPTVVEALARLCDVVESSATSDTDRSAAREQRRSILAASEVTEGDPKES